MHTAGSGLDHHGIFVGEALGGAMNLALVGDELFAPSAAGAAAEAGLNTVTDIAGEQVAVIEPISGRSALERRVRIASFRAQDRFEDHSFTVLGHANNFVTRNEGKTHEVVEVSRRVPIDGGEIRTADPGEDRRYTNPLALGQVWFGDVGQLERANTGAGARANLRGDRRCGIASFLAFKNESFHTDILPEAHQERRSGPYWPISLDACSVSYTSAMRILCADTLADELLEPLRSEGHEVVVDAALTVDTLPAALAENPADVLVVRSTKVNREAITASNQLGLIVRAGAGTDNIDKLSASEHGVYVSNVPGKNAIAVAELAMGLLLAIDRHIPASMADFTAGQWNKATYSKADGIHGKTLAIVGLGEIGFALAQRATAFGMSVTALAKPGRSGRSLRLIEEGDIGLVETLDELLAGADVVSIHVPKSPETTGMVNAEFLAKMAPNAVLLNTARGDVVDEAALLAAMDDRGIRAGLDVWPGEPTTSTGEWESALANHPNVVGTHHVGASTAQAQAAVAAGTVDVITAYLAGHVMNCVNLEKDTAGGVILTVRHLDKVGVLAKVFETLRAAGLNVRQMENNLFTGSVAAVASINLERSPDAQLLEQLEGDADILSVSVS